MTDTFPSSASAIAKKDVRVREGFAPKYPWGTMSINTSFMVLASDVKLSSLVPYANRMGRKLGKKFVVVDWPAANPPCYEVAFVGIREVKEVKEKKDTPKTIFDVMEKKD